MKIIVICGFSKSGKTTTAINLIRELKKKAYSVSYAKDIHSKNIVFDGFGTDTDKAFKAGADKVIGNNSEINFTLAKDKLLLAEIIKETKSDFLILEGYKNSSYEKIVCLKDEDDLEKTNFENVLCYAGVYSENGKTNIGKYKLINAKTNAEEIIKMITKEKEESKTKIILTVNGKTIPMIDFVSKTLTDIILAYAKNLKKIEEIKNLSIEIEVNKK